MPVRWSQPSRNSFHSRIIQLEEQSSGEIYVARRRLRSNRWENGKFVKTRCSTPCGETVPRLSYSEREREQKAALNIRLTQFSFPILFILLEDDASRGS